MRSSFAAGYESRNLKSSRSHLTGHTLLSIKPSHTVASLNDIHKVGLSDGLSLEVKHVLLGSFCIPLRGPVLERNIELPFRVTF